MKKNGIWFYCRFMSPHGGATVGSLGKDLLLPALLGDDGARLVLRVRVIGQLRGAGGHGTAHDQLLQVVEQMRVLLGHEGHRLSRQPRSARTPNPVRVVCNEMTLARAHFLATTYKVRTHWVASMGSPGTVSIGIYIFILFMRHFHRGFEIILLTL